jgi:hypothetical protein
MKGSELVAEMQELIKKHGDFVVARAVREEGALYDTFEPISGVDVGQEYNAYRGENVGPKYIVIS